MKLLLSLVVVGACVAVEQRRSAGLTPRHSGYTSTYHGAYNPGHGTYSHGTYNHGTRSGYGTYNHGTRSGYGTYNRGLGSYNHGSRHSYVTYGPGTYRHRGYTPVAQPYVQEHKIWKRNANPEPTFLLHRILHHPLYRGKHHRKYHTRTSTLHRYYPQSYVHTHSIGKRDVALENEGTEALHKIEERHATQETEEGESNHEIAKSDATHEIERRQAINENENEIEDEQAAHEIVAREAHDPADVHGHSGDHHGVYYGHNLHGYHKYHGYGYGYPWHGGYYHHYDHPVRSYTVNKKTKREADPHQGHYWYPYYGHSNWNHGHTHYNTLHSHGLYKPTSVAHHPKGGHSYVRTSGIGKRSAESQIYLQTSDTVKRSDEVNNPGSSIQTNKIMKRSAKPDQSQTYVQTNDITKRSAEPGTPHVYHSNLHYGHPWHATYGYNTKVVHPNNGVSYQYHHGGVVPYHGYQSHYYG